MMTLQESIFNQTEQANELYRIFLQEGLSSQVISQFQNIIYDYYKHHVRSFSWRTTISPYRVVVSEVMLQQTQTYRVAEKFDDFIEQFPSFQALANAPFEQVLRAWKGLGYNRRAMNLQKIASIVTEQHKGTLPNTPEILVTLPGIGPATASSICAFAFNSPTIFIETNIRTVFIYFFFRDVIDKPIVDDKELTPLINATVDQQQARQWYYALMDYGVMLKKTVGNLSRLSKHYTKQSKFNGSDRQIRGAILQAALDNPDLSMSNLFILLNKDHDRVRMITEQLVNEGFIRLIDNKIYLY